MLSDSPQSSILYDSMSWIDYMTNMLSRNIDMLSILSSSSILSKTKDDISSISFSLSVKLIFGVDGSVLGESDDFINPLIDVSWEDLFSSPKGI